ncbi:MAG: hypothetical protein RLZ98_2608 [Pseudomonadota bacterium]|jgi:hypothetical protein
MTKIFLESAKWLFAIALSMIVAIMSLFVLVDIYPPAIKQLGLHTLGRFALRDRYIADDDLVFTYRDRKLVYENYAGDQYRPEYGPPPLKWNGIHEFDDDGFRNRNLKQSYPVVVVGDSFVEFGRSNDHTVSAYLTRAAGEPVLDLGRGWYGPEQYLKVFERYGLKRASRDVIFFFFEGNDLKDISQYADWKTSRTYYQFPSTNLLQRYYRDLEWATERFTQAFGRFAARGNAVNSANASEIHPDLALVGLRDQEPFTMFIGYNQENMSAAEIESSATGRRLGDILARISQLSRENSIRSHIVFIPTKGRVYSRFAHDGGTNWMTRRSAASFDGEHVETAVASIVRRAGLEFVSLTPAFTAAADQGRLLFYRFDSHWNTDGRELAAKVVATHLALSRSSAKQ